MAFLSIVTLNIRGLNDPVKCQTRVEVAFLQETHLLDTEHAKLKRLGFKYQYSSSYQDGHRRGVAILISNGTSFEPIFEKKDTEGRFVLMRGNLGGSLVTLFNIYAPPNSDWKFFKQIFDLITAETQGVLICGGDLNIRLNPKLDSSNTHLSQPKLINKKINLAMKEIGLIDIWRELNPLKRDYTFFSNPHSAYSRIDYFFTFTRDLDRVDGCNMGSMDLSDHSPIYLELNLEQHRRNTMWRLNTFVLNQMKEQIRKDIAEYLEQNDNGEVSPPMLWDACKAVLRGKLIGYSAHLKRAKQKELVQLEGELKQLEQNHKNTNHPKIKEQLDKIRNKINETYTKAILKKLIFTKQKYYEGGGKAKHSHKNQTKSSEIRRILVDFYVNVLKKHF
uniref:exodeoxyribonuclease III n=1 Tax=Amphiprion percula TaxID=161767 RepID=A0A3P8S6T2_AMPPE